MALYLYGVGHRSLSVPVGVAGVMPSTGDCEVVTDGDLGALVTELAERKPAITTSNLAAHERVVEAVAEEEDFVPARFGVVADTRETLVSDLLRARRAELTMTLEELSDSIELRLTVTHQGDALLREALARNPCLARLGRRVRGRPAAASYYDRISLGEVARNEVLRLQQRDLDVLQMRLGRVVAKSKQLSGPDGATARMAYLISRHDLQRFDDELEAFAAEHEGRVRVELVGPLAPWDFANVGNDAEGEAMAGRRRPRQLEGQGTR